MPETKQFLSSEVACPVCQAKPGEPCTAATSTGRRPVTWYHSGRSLAAIDAGERVGRVVKADRALDARIAAATLAERVFAGLPADGHSIAFLDLLPVIDTDLHADGSAVRAALVELRSAGRAEVVYGRGWRRRSVPAETPEQIAVRSITVPTTHATSASERYDAARKALAAFDDFNIEVIGDDGYELIGSVERSAWVIKRLRALIEPPATVETPEQMAEAWRKNLYQQGTINVLGNKPWRELCAEAYRQGIRAGILAAWESWEPENAPGVTE